MGPAGRRRGGGDARAGPRTRRSGSRSTTSPCFADRRPRALRRSRWLRWAKRVGELLGARRVRLRRARDARAVARDPRSRRRADGASRRGCRPRIRSPPGLTVWPVAEKRAPAASAAGADARAAGGLDPRAGARRRRRLRLQGHPAPSETPCVAAAAALQLARPVKWAEDRLENFLAAPRRGAACAAAVELARTRDGRILALRARLLADLGAYLPPEHGDPAAHDWAMLPRRLLRDPGVRRPGPDRRAHVQGAPRRPTAGQAGRRPPTSSRRALDQAARELGRRSRGAGDGCYLVRGVPLPDAAGAGPTTPATTSGAWTRRSRWPSR